MDCLGRECHGGWSISRDISLVFELVAKIYEVSDAIKLLSGKIMIFILIFCTKDEIVT